MRTHFTALVCAAAVTACTATYNAKEVQQATAKLDPTRGVLISTPDNGSYGDTQYQNSGSMTAQAVRAAFLQHTGRADITTNCHGEACLSAIDTAKYGYYIKPEILHWEDRATEWSGKADRLEIQLMVFDAATGALVANSTYTGKSKWATFGGDHPQDLLPEPTRTYVNSLYQ